MEDSKLGAGHLRVEDTTTITMRSAALHGDGAVRAAIERYCERFTQMVAAVGTDVGADTSRTYTSAQGVMLTVEFASATLTLTTTLGRIEDPIVRAVLDDLVILVLATLSREATNANQATITCYSAGVESGNETVTLPVDTRRLMLDFRTGETSPVRVVGVDDSSIQNTTDAQGRMIFANHPEPKTEPVDTVRIFYATDRALEKIDGVETFGAGRDLLRYGYCDVDLPSRRWVGEIEPSFFRRMLIVSAARLNVGAPNTTDANKFYKLLSDRIATSSKKRAFVFVHGFNVSFDVAVGRAAQLHADLGFDGATVVYSWPSRGKPSAYLMDAAAVEAGRHRFARLLRELVDRTEATEVHILAHSMGNRAVTRALEQLVPELLGRSPVHQLLLAAPDVDAVEMENMLPALKQIVRRITLYGSSKDKPLTLSELLTGWPRAGDGGKYLLCAPDYADCVDASEIDTAYLSHSYAMDNPALLADIKALIDDDKPPGNRFGITGFPNGTWAFRGRHYQ